MKNYLFLLLVTFSLNTFSQEYKVLDTTDFKQRSALIKSYREEFKQVQKKLNRSYRGKFKKSVLQSHSETQQQFLLNIMKKELVFNPVFTNYLDSITKIIVTKNPSLKQENLRVYLARFNSPNAMSLGNGIVILNMGLLKYLDTENQFVAVLAHEIAHQKLRHVEESILYRAEMSTSKERRAEAKKIKKQKYNHYDKAFDVLKNLLYTSSNRHRSQEVAADSLGYEMFKKTAYDKKGFINALQILEELDSLPSIELKKSIYKTFFDLPNQAFKESWLKKESFDDYTYFESKEVMDKDSMRSHPEITERITRLKARNAELNIKEKESFKGSSTFIKLQKIARQEDVANLHYLGKYGLSLYLTLNRLRSNPDSKYYKSWIGTNFKALYTAKKAYKFNKYVDSVNHDEQDESYQQFLNFMWNLSLKEIKEIADFYAGN